MVLITIDRDSEQQRVDRFLRKLLPKAPLGYIYKIVRTDLKVNGKRVKPEHMLSFGDEVKLFMPQDLIDSYSQELKSPDRKSKKQFTVVYEDDNILLVSKPKGLLTHGDKTEKKNTLVNQVVGYLVDKGDYRFSRTNTFVPAPVNRLDRNTSGLVIFGKNNVALQALNRMIKDKESIEKYYIAAARGELAEEVVIRSTMEKDSRQNMIKLRPAEREDLKYMETVIRPLKVKDGFTLVEAQLITGRTHQIRAHMASKKLYILGDVKYGSPGGNSFAKKNFGLTTQFLHAYRLRFDKCPEPFAYLNGREFTAPLPEELEKIKKRLFD